MTTHPTDSNRNPRVSTPAQTEALVIAGVILDDWSKTVETFARISDGSGAPAEAYSWRKVHAALRSAAMLFKAAAHCDYDFLTQAQSDGYARSFDDRGPETTNDILTRVENDVKLLFGGDSAMTTQVMQLVIAVQNGAGIVQLSPTQAGTPMNRQQRRAHARKNR